MATRPGGMNRTSDAAVLRLASHYGTARANVQRRPSARRVARAVRPRPFRKPGSQPRPACTVLHAQDRADNRATAIPRPRDHNRNP